MKYENIQDLINNYIVKTFIPPKKICQSCLVFIAVAEYWFETCLVSPQGAWMDTVTLAMEVFQREVHSQLVPSKYFLQRMVVVSRQNDIAYDWIVFHNQVIWIYHFFYHCKRRWRYLVYAEKGRHFVKELSTFKTLLFTYNFIVEKLCWQWVKKKLNWAVSWLLLWRL